MAAETLGRIPFNRRSNNLIKRTTDTFHFSPVIALPSALDVRCALNENAFVQVEGQRRQTARLVRPDVSGHDRSVLCIPALIESLFETARKPWATDGISGSFLVPERSVAFSRGSDGSTLLAGERP
jgi:hypothetical protein